MKKWICCTILLVLATTCNEFALGGGAEQQLGRQRHEWDVRWVLLKYGNGELVKEPDVAWEEMRRHVHRAAKAGYNGIVFADRDENWYQGENSAFWRQRLAELRKLTRSLGMQLLCACVPAKGGGTAEMAESFPVHDARMVIQDGVFAPVNTAIIRNGSFEQFEGNTPAHFKLPEAGKHAFVELEAKAQDGVASLRVENFGDVRGRLAMPVQTVVVKPFHQYRVSFWMKISEDFSSTIRVMARVPGDGGKDRDICHQEPSIGRRHRATSGLSCKRRSTVGTIRKWSCWSAQSTGATGQGAPSGWTTFRSKMCRY